MEEDYLIINKGINNKTDIEIFVVGNIFNKNTNSKLSTSEIKQMYENYKEKIYLYLDGTYSLVICDYKDKKIYAYRDYFGGGVNIYYYISNDQIILSNRLRDVVLNVNSKLCINNKAVKQFLVNGFERQNYTLIDQINKIPLKKYGIFDLSKSKICLKNLKHKNKKYLNVTNDMYLNTFKKMCFPIIDGDNDINTTISTGFDTNLILYSLNEISKCSINGYCIGGAIGRNEIEQASKICKCYNNVRFYSKVVDYNSFNNYPEIVYILEGSTYEYGIFLQYELANLLKKHNVNKIIAGDCADQILNFETYHNLNLFKHKVIYNLKKIPKLIFKKVFYKPYKDPYEMASYKILNKNRQILNHFNIKTYYPYLRNDFVTIAKNIVKKNDFEKKYHKNVINTALPKKVTQYLVKIPGSTELKALFNNDLSLEKVIKACTHSIFYKPKKFDDKFYEIDYYLKIIYIELFKEIFITSSDRFLKGDIKKFKLIDFLNNF